MAEKKEYRIKVQGQLVPVTEEIYLTYYRMRRRELHLAEKDSKHGVMSYNGMDTEETNGEDAIPDLVSPRVEDMVVDKLMSQRLHQCIVQLAAQEQELLQALFFQGKSEREYSKFTGIHYMTIHARKVRVLTKLKKLLEK